MMEMLTNLVTQSGVGATQLSAILLGVLFLTMIIGLATGQELAFVLGGAGVIIGYLAWGGPGITIAMTKVYDQMQSYSMVAIPMFVLMANFLTHCLLPRPVSSAHPLLPWACCPYRCC